MAYGMTVFERTCQNSHMTVALIHRVTLATVSPARVKPCLARVKPCLARVKPCRYVSIVQHKLGNFLALKLQPLHLGFPCLQKMKS